METIEKVVAFPGTPELEGAWRVYRENAGTLGFLPRGAFDEFAEDGRIIVAVVSGSAVGYIAWRQARQDAVLVHLCVGREHRGRGVANVLMDAFAKETKDLASVRLSCRADYPENKLWPKYYFQIQGERPGRGEDRAPLLLWRKTNWDPPLLAAMQPAKRDGKRVAAVDANVFFDLHGPSPHDESRALEADWLDDIELCVTAELFNELTRQPDALQRRRMESAANRYRVLKAPDAARLDAMYNATCALLPKAQSHSDGSDRRQIAHAVLGEAEFFVSRDGGLLDHAVRLKEHLGILVVRPAELITHLHRREDEAAYQPVRLAGTAFARRLVTDEALLWPFQRFSDSETKARWQRTVRAYMAEPQRYRVEVIGDSTDPARIAFVLDRADADELRLPVLRTLSGPLTATLLRRLLGDLLESIQGEARQSMRVEAPGDPDVEAALLALEFTKEASSWVKRSLRAVVAKPEVDEVIGFRVAGAAKIEGGTAAELESRFWPLKVTDAGLPCYIVPIRPWWAAALFDRHLAECDLFGPRAGPALSLENVYYSRSRIEIPAGSRILWYVSTEGKKKVQQIRACSAALGTDVGSATALFRRYRRLGVYDWSDVRKAASGDPHGSLAAFRFARTELLRAPVPWKTLEEAILKYCGTRNRVPTALKIPEACFVHLYRAGMQLEPAA